MRYLGSKTAAAITNFWNRVRPDDTLVWEHPAFADDPPAELVIPWSSHGDGVPTTKAGAGGMSLHVVSSSSLVGVGCTLDTHFLNWALPSTIAVKRKPRGCLSSDPLWSVYVWDALACASGIHSYEDHEGVMFPPDSPRGLLAGTPIAGGYRLAHLYQRADLDWHVNEMTNQHWSSHGCCFKCPANKSDCHTSSIKHSFYQVDNLPTLSLWIPPTSRCINPH